MENPSTAPRGLVKGAPRGFFLRGHLQHQRGELTLRGLRVHLGSEVRVEANDGKIIGKMRKTIEKP